jgi:hypothetical protein
LLLPVLLTTRLPFAGAVLYALALLLFLVSCRMVQPPAESPPSVFRPTHGARRK